jgi:predicted nucleic acid-binding protein
MNSILLDTSFCIRLLKRDDAFHKNAVDYFQYFLGHKIEMYLSAIVIAEYSVKDDISNLPLRTMKIIPFDFIDGKTSGEFHSVLIKNKESIQGIDRLVVKDDCKLIAQIYNRKIDAYITKDKKSFSQIFAPLQAEKGFSIQLLDLAIPLKDFKGELF